MAGSVVDAIIGPGATIEPGADVRHSVLMGDVVVRSGARVSRSVLAENVVVGKGAQVGAPNARRPVLVGTHRRIPAGTTVDPGTHLEPHKPRGILRSSK